MIEEQSDENPFYQVYWSRATHMGEAIQQSLNAALENGLQNPLPCSCDYDNFDDIDEEVEPDSNSDVFWSITRNYFPLEESFVLPTGIIGAWPDAEHDVTDITQGYTMDKTEDGMTTIYVNADREQLFPLYERLLRLNPTYKVFWYMLHDHWDDESEDRFLINEKLDSSEKIIEHLVEHESDSVQNGFVTLTAYLEQGATNLSISDHKRIVITTFSEEVARQYADLLDGSAYPKMSEMLSIEHKMHH